MLLLASAPAHAQQSVDRAPSWEARADYLGTRAGAIHGGAGVSVAAGPSVRAALVAGAGATLREGDPSGRVEAVLRLLLDPRGERRWSPYGAGGLGVRWDRGRAGQAALVALVGVEGPPLGGRVRPALEAGVGYGLRVAVVLRPTMPAR